MYTKHTMFHNYYLLDEMITIEEFIVKHSAFLCT